MSGLGPAGQVACPDCLSPVSLFGRLLSISAASCEPCEAVWLVDELVLLPAESVAAVDEQAGLP